MIKKFILNFGIFFIIFFTDRISKIYILELAEKEDIVDIYITSYLNFFLIWNKGVAFGLFSFDESIMYKIVTSIIFIIIIVIFILILKNDGFKKYSLMSIFAGSIGNFFDRVYYSAVPDFIDLHINNFHWFIFNVADIFITIGVIFMVLMELGSNNQQNNEQN